MKWTLVTGGAKNLGATLCRTLARQGYSVVIHYNKSEKEARALVKECSQYNVSVDCIQGDFSTPDNTAQFIKNYQEKFGDTKNIINNVGNYFLGSSIQTPLHQWMELFQTNLHAPYQLIQCLLPSIIKERGSVINIGVSGLSTPHANTYSTAYFMTKSNLLILTKSLALELAPKQVRVNMISPGYLEVSVDLPKDLTKIPMHRPGKNAEVADMVLYLLSDKAAYITGQNIEIAGGMGL